jgi:hypothetical protein
MDLYPHINIDPSKFLIRPRTFLFISLFPLSLPFFLFLFIEGYWFNKKNVRKFLDELAESHGFDPLNAENWYRITTNNIFARKV